jgi:hypothetical protein
MIYPRRRIAGLARRRADRAHFSPSSSRRIAPPIYPDLIYDRHAVFQQYWWTADLRIAPLARTLVTPKPTLAGRSAHVSADIRLSAIRTSCRPRRWWFSAAGQHARACDQSMFSMRSRAFAHAPQRSRGRPDSAGNVKKADLLRVRVVERMNRLGGRLQQDRAALFRKIRLSFRR